VDRPKLLIVEDDEALRTQYRYALREEYELAFAGDGRQALRQFAALRPALVSLDLGLPPRPARPDEGFAVLEQILELDPTARVIVVTGHHEREHAVRALHLGATDYHFKPVDLDELRVVLRRAAFLHGFEAGGEGGGPAGARFEEILGSTPKMKEIFGLLEQVARTDVTVLLEGESGTGKELAARAIHARSARRDGPFVAINCGAIPETLLESELFGSEKGAYTGAHARRRGKLELAHGGTLFLDEIGEMSPPLQVKLLRFLQERRLERVGGHEQIPVDTRVIAATNKALRAEIQAGRFREDLYYRLSVIVITMPPLRERGEDLVLLANAFLRRACHEHRRRLRFSPAALQAITRHPWPGNIRELENAVQRGVIMARGRLVEPADMALAPAPVTAVPTLREARHETERRLLVDALTRTQGNISRAARELGVSRPAIHDLLDKHRVDARQFRPTA
jgi:two-component system NtrC family response regulator